MAQRRGRDHRRRPGMTPNPFFRFLFPFVADGPAMPAPESCSDGAFSMSVDPGPGMALTRFVGAPAVSVEPVAGESGPAGTPAVSVAPATPAAGADGPPAGSVAPGGAESGPAGTPAVSVAPARPLPAPAGAAVVSVETPAPPRS